MGIWWQRQSPVEEPELPEHSLKEG